MAIIETVEAANRLARAIVSDIATYNEEKVLDGLKKDALFEVLAEELEEGRALYRSRVSPELYSRNFYDRAIVDVLVRQRGHVPSPLW